MSRSFVYIKPDGEGGTDRDRERQRDSVHSLCIE